MTKAQLIEKIHKDVARHLKKKDTTVIIEAVFEQLHKTIRKEKRFSYPGFGTFHIQKRKARKGRNPSTGQEIIIPATKTVTFKPAPNFKAKL
ncbi:MAG: HU family DNA-binding protein [Myxococcota bacterium]|jgi:DNA-binding protein HU-beta|nr:HU family DNA-binding protein [Myxococcota bacterium]